MRITLAIPLVLALTAAGATDLAAQSGTLSPFGSEVQLRRYLRQHAGAAGGSVASAPVPALPCAPDTSLRAERVGGAEQPAVIAGRVTYGDSAVAGAYLGAVGITATSGADGGYRLAVPAARLAGAPCFSVSASRIGFASRARALALAPGDSVRVDFQLTAAAVEIAGLVTTALAMERDGESVTNTQHAGVDEGGIVKSHGDHLVVLRRGRLFTIAIGDDQLRPVSVVDAFAPGADPAAWYDEMLVSEDRVVVIGYGYAGDRESGTEINLFGISPDGRLSYQSTYRLRSDDYYSSRNYASRLIGEKLVFYTPMYLYAPEAAEDLSGYLPSVRRWRPGAEQAPEKAILTPRRIYRPGRDLGDELDVALHTVTVCDLARAEMACEATAVLGPEGRVFYVAPEAVYVWTTPWFTGKQEAENASTVYRIPLDGSAPSGVRVSGSPVDQFSFLEGDDEVLNVVVRSDGGGEMMWSSEHAGGDVALLRIPLSRFGNGRAAAPRSAYRPLPSAEGGAFQNRFVGDYLLYGAGTGWRRPRPTREASLVAVRLRGGDPVRVPLPHAVDRIEAMGRDALVVGSDGKDLHFSGIALGSRPAARQHYVSAGASQGETRSHGFFYKPDGEDAGTIGLPIRGPADPGYAHLVEESSSVLFLRNQDREFRPLGLLEGHLEGALADGCRASCVDWYGNSRPLFLRGRVFALLGYEVVEGRVDDGRIREVRRLNFAPAVAGELTRR